MKTLEEIMNYNWNFHKECKVAPNCRFDEGQKLAEHFRDCVDQWLEEYRLDIQTHGGDPDVKDWFYMAIGELKVAINRNKQTEENKNE